MHTRYNYNNKYILRWKHPSVFKSFGLYNTIQNPKIQLTFNFNNLKSKDFLTLIEGLYFIELLTGQRPFMNKIVKSKLINKSSNDYKVQVTLRRFYACNFLDFLFQFILEDIFKDESIKINFNINFQGNCSFILKDLSFVPGIKEEGLYWKKGLKIDNVINNSESEKSNCILDQIGFIL